MKIYGLIGKKLGHSFSKKYFEDLFAANHLPDHRYELFELEEVGEVARLINDPDLRGFNVTIPYKQEIIPFLKDISPEAQSVGAVNTVKVNSGSMSGHNTDTYGFEKSLGETVDISKIKSALILGTGGASKAVAFVLDKCGIPYTYVSRKKGTGYSYENLKENTNILSENALIINTTPLGMFPDIASKPDLPYNLITENHILFDLVYNPEVTAFLAEGVKRGATTKNGLDMLHYQADQAWQIWNNNEK